MRLSRLAWLLLPAAVLVAVVASGQAGPMWDYARARYHFGRGMDLYQDGKHAQARAEFDIASQLAPQRKHLDEEIALFYVWKRELPNAVPYLERAVKAYQEPPLDLVIVLAQGLVGQRRAAEASPWMDWLEKQQIHDPDVLGRVGELLANCERYAAAVPYLSRAIQTKAKEWQQLRLTLAYCYARLDQKQEARAILDPIADRDPQRSDTCNMVAYSYAVMGERLDVAETLALRALRGMPRNGAVLDTLAWVHYKQGRLQQALRELQQALRWAPEEREIQEHLREVQAALESAREKSPSQSRYGPSLGGGTRA